MNEDIGLDFTLILSLAVTVLGGAWIAFKGTELYERWEHTAWYRRFDLIIKIIEGAVLETEEEFVRPVKAKSLANGSGGKMSDEMRARAFTNAKRRATTEAAKNNIDLEATLGGQLAVRTEIERAVERLTKPGPEPIQPVYTGRGFEVPFNNGGATPL